jgi:hypothetical protein
MSAEFPAELLDRQRLALLTRSIPASLALAAALAGTAMAAQQSAPSASAVATTTPAVPASSSVAVNTPAGSMRTANAPAGPGGATAASGAGPATGATGVSSAAAGKTRAASEQAQILADTKRLFELSAELKIDLVKSSPDTLSLDVIKKAAEVEKLALILNQRMKH